MPIDKSYPKKTNKKDMPDETLEKMDENAQNKMAPEQDPSESEDACKLAAAERGFGQTGNIRCDQKGATGQQDTTHEKQKVTPKENQVEDKEEHTDDKSWKKYDWEK